MKTGVRDAKRAPKALWVCPVCGEKRVLLAEWPTSTWPDVPCPNNCGGRMARVGIIMVRSLDRTKIVCQVCGTTIQFRPGMILCPRGCGK